MSYSTAWGRKPPEKKGKKMRQDFSKLLKTNVEKMSTFRLSMMSMKTKPVTLSFP